MNTYIVTTQGALEGPVELHDQMEIAMCSEHYVFDANYIDEARQQFSKEILKMSESSVTQDAANWHQFSTTKMGRVVDNTTNDSPYSLIVTIIELPVR